MNTPNWDVFHVLKEWVLALAAVILTFALAPAVGAFLRRFKDHPRWAFMYQLSRAISLMVYPIGLRIALDLAPVGHKAERWTDAAVYLLFVVLLMNLLRQAAMIAVEWSALRGPKTSATFQQGFIPLLRNIVVLIVFTMGGIMVLKYFGYDVMSLVAALGVGSLAVGLAAKDTLSNMISGFTLILDHNLRPGDKINLGGTVGVVEEIGLRSTRLNIRDGNTLIVPNQDLVNTKILNMTMQGPASACSTKFRVPITVPFQRVKGICLELHPQIEQAWAQKGGWVQLASVSDGNQLITTGFWVYDSDQIANALTDFHVKLVDRMAREEIPLLGEVFRISRSDEASKS